MKISRKMYAVVIGLVVSTAVYATTQDESESSQEMPMMNQAGGMMMDPETMSQMMASGQHQNMPMMGHQNMHQMMHQMPYSGHGMPMMGGGMGNMMHPQMMGGGMGNMMHPQMMGGGMGNMMNPQMMQMRMQHMMKMEQHLEKIESLLTQILEAQKPK
jgi:hypothetical protein